MSTGQALGWDDEARVAERESDGIDLAELSEALAFIDPATLSQDEWLACMMAWHYEGGDCPTFDAWSAQDAKRYKERKNHIRWDSLHDDSADPVTGATIFRFAYDRGWTGGTSTTRSTSHTQRKSRPKPKPKKHAAPIVRKLTDVSLKELDESPDEQMQIQLRAMFEDGELVNIVTDCATDGKGPGHGEVVEASFYREHAAETLSKVDPAIGAWIRVNPLKGNGIGNDDMAEFRHALIEQDPDNADEMTPDQLRDELDRQLKLILSLNLPCASIVDSGGKSIHAIVRVDAKDAAEYRERVRWLFEYCELNGMGKLDAGNKNVSRLSRLAGARRGENIQRLIAVNTGATSWDEFRKWVDENAVTQDEENDEDEDGEPLDYDSFFRSYDDIATQKTRPEFDWLIPGIVARGLLTLMTASAGVGKTDTLYQMFDAAVSGGQWLAYRFDRKLNALYVDPEMDEQGTDARFYDIREERKTEYSPNPDYRRDIIQYLSLEPQQRAKIDTIAKLIPFLRGSGRRFDLIIIDSIAALMPKDGDGSENDNLFVRNQLESLASFAKDMGAGVVVSHHTGKAVGQGLRNGNAARGASAWKDVPSVVMEMHPLSTRKSKEAQTMIESLSVERWDYVFRRNVRRFPQPIRLLYRKNRYTAHLPQLDMLYRYPLHIVKDDYWDIQAILRDCKIAADPAEAAAREKQEQAKERVSDEAKAILAIIDDVHAEGLLATCENVYPRFSDWRDENGYDKELSLVAFKKACTPSGRLPFTKDRKTRELVHSPDESETEADS